MKAHEYISYYNLNRHFPIMWRNDPNCTVHDFLENNPDYDIDDIEFSMYVLGNEKWSLKKHLERFRDETEMISSFREMFDEYRRAGGIALNWLYFTFKHVSLNPQSIPARHRGIIEKCLIQWIDNYEKQPFDLLELNVTAINRAEQQEEERQNIKSPVISLFCYIVSETKLLEKEEAESIESFCKRVCKMFDLEYRDRIRQGFYVSENMANYKKMIEQLLPLVDEEKLEVIIGYLTKNNITKKRLYG